MQGVSMGGGDGRPYHEVGIALREIDGGRVEIRSLGQCFHNAAASQGRGDLRFVSPLC